MKIIILIIASHAEHYDQMINIWKKYMNNHPNITSFFIMNDENIDEDVVIKENIMYVKANENYIPGILQKTIRTIEYCLQHFEFDFIYRTNLSSFLVLEKLFNFVNKNNHIQYGGVIGGPTPEGIKFASGAGFLMARDICKYLIDNENKLLYYNYLDDVAIAEVLTKNYEISFIPRIDNNPEYDDYNFENFKNNECFHYRCKDLMDRYDLTILFMNKLYDLFYN